MKKSDKEQEKSRRERKSGYDNWYARCVNYVGLARGRWFSHVPASSSARSSADEVASALRRPSPNPFLNESLSNILSNCWTIRANCSRCSPVRVSRGGAVEPFDTRIERSIRLTRQKPRKEERKMNQPRVMRKKDIQSLAALTSFII